MVGTLPVLAALLVAYGEQDAEGHPNMEERLLHVLTNQIRQEPHAWPGWDTAAATNEPRQALYIDGGLYEAARFHAEDMAANACFQHESCDGTSFEARMSRYFSGPAGENIAGNFDHRSAMTAWMNSPGHRMNILLARYTVLGTGFASSTPFDLWVQDFGMKDVSRTMIPAGAVERIGAGKIRLIANYFDAQNQAPPAFEAVLGGQNIPMDPIAGPDGNATYEVTTNEPSGCTPIYFRARDTVFPSTGALLTGTGCNQTFQAENPDHTPDGRPVIDADDERGCRCAGRRNATALLLLPLFLLVFMKKIA